MELQQREVVRFLHISDTHGLHRQVEELFPMPEADILIHTGDFTDTGSAEEFSDFNTWLGELSQRYPHIIVIFGNHEYKGDFDHQRTKQLLPNATVLNHESIDVLGLRIFGSSWVYGHKAASPGDNRVPHRFDEIPNDIDVLLTHGSPFGIMDCCELRTIQWGGSEALCQAILRARPRVHLFGHMHEQRGLWWHAKNEQFQGGIEYDIGGGKVHPTWEPPASDYPCELISCNAMKNHPRIDVAVGKANVSRIAGPARLIIADRRHHEPEWRFSAAGQDLNEVARRKGA